MFDIYYVGRNIMVRGYQKRIIHLKNTESAVFDEAFFLVNERSSKGMCERELIREANRIVDDSLREKENRANKIREYFLRAVFLFTGAAISSAIWLLLTLV